MFLINCYSLSVKIQKQILLHFVLARDSRLKIFRAVRISFSFTSTFNALALVFNAIAW